MQLDLNKGVNLKIEGEAGKYSTLPIDVLIKVAENLQKLVQDIAKYEIDSPYNIDLNNFKIELSGFRHGSAVPAFKFTPRVKFTIDSNQDVVEQRNVVNGRFNRYMEIADNGDYSKLRNECKNNISRNAIVRSLGNFANSTGNSPMSFSKISSEGKVISISKVNKIKPKVIESLITKIEDLEAKSEDKFGVATIKEVTTKTGHKRRKIVDDIMDHDATLSFSFSEIQFMGRQYVLKGDLNCKLQKEEGYYVIENSILDIVGTGDSVEEAKMCFSEEFDYIYKRYNELKEEELTSRTKTARDFINLIISQIM
ncbi:MAG: hypothetical protein GXO88_14370 [Chlorobi bacterium]|nr:hypothetical protein [Chlorobiota bacterium]